MKKLIFATTNQGKMREIREILKDMEYEIISLKDAGIDVEIEENGTTFEENALIKAREISRITNELVLADDSGLEVDYLNKAPGIYSARFAGENTPYSIKNKMIIDKLQGVSKEERSARFVCVIAACFPDGREYTTRGTIEGFIGYEERGTNGFGYDPIVYIEELGKTTGELTIEEKNKISHRGKALTAMKKYL